MLRRMFQSFLSAQEMLRARPLWYLFVLGHVRSGSSLLVHILITYNKCRQFLICIWV